MSYILVQSISNNRDLLELKQQLESNKNSDHFIFYQLYQVEIKIFGFFKINI